MTKVKKVKAVPGVQIKDIGRAYKTVRLDEMFLYLDGTWNASQFEEIGQTLRGLELDGSRSCVPSWEPISTTARAIVKCDRRSTIKTERRVTLDASTNRDMNTAIAWVLSNVGPDANDGMVLGVRLLRTSHIADSRIGGVYKYDGHRNGGPRKLFLEKIRDVEHPEFVPVEEVSENVRRIVAGGLFVHEHSTCLLQQKERTRVTLKQYVQCA